MSDNLYGKIGFYLVRIGFPFLVASFFVSIMFGWLMPEGIFIGYYGLSIVFIILGIILAIVGIVKDDSREKAITALIGGICFLIVGISMIVLYNIYLNALFG